MAMALTSAASIIALLDEPDSELQVHALTSLNQLVDVFWAEIARAITKIEVLYEDEKFAQRHLAASIASKVFYHLEDLDDALRYALGAGDLFDIAIQSEYTETLIAKCIDEYIRLRVAGKQAEIDKRLDNIVSRMFDRCFEDGQYKQALGIALESHRMDKVQESIASSNDQDTMLSYCFTLAQEVIHHRDFRQEVFRELANIYTAQSVPDYISICQCLLYLDDAKAIAVVLESLLRKEDSNEWLMAYQVAYELSENENLPFLIRVSNALPPSTKPISVSSDASRGTEEAMDTSEDGVASQDSGFNGRLENIRCILDGESQISLYTQFLYTHNKTDILIIQTIKDHLENRNSVTHCAAIVSHALMHVGTTRDKFIRDNLDWLSRATNWNKFSVTASFGIIHKGHLKQSMKIFEPYLPKDGVQGSPYLEGGALYGLGLIHANRNADKKDYLLNALRNAGNNEIVQHGACLGLGLNCMATGDVPLYETLKGVLFHDNAVVGASAGVAIGLVLLGSGNGAAIEEMLAYSHDTQHDKIIRGLSLGMALIMSGLEDQSDPLIDQLLSDKDPILRYGGCFTIALAYAATANNSAVRRLLHVAVSDASDDVRRVSVIALGFVLCNVPERVPKVVTLLAESYNAHVRYGAALAVGVACAGTGSKAALSVLASLTKDRTYFVRQGAMIAKAMVLIQLNKKEEPDVEEFRDVLRKSLESKHGDTMTKLGAILASGIVDAGGRNVSICLRSGSGHRRTAAIVGMAMFLQYWYWYPYTHFISLSFTPTVVIGLNKDLKMPKNFEFRSNRPPSMFAYPAVMELKKQEEAKVVDKAELSTAAKTKAKAAAKKKDKEDEEAKEAMDSTEDNKDDGAQHQEDGGTSSEKAPQPESPEPDFEILKNPARVTTRQRRIVSLEADQRYVPITKKLMGITLLVDTRPDEPEELILAERPQVFGVGEEDEPAPPIPFQFTR